MKLSTEQLKEKLTTEKEHDFESLIQLVEVLRSEGGCPWDIEQTHESIRSDIIEETYEVIEAIDKQDMTLLREELGDVMFQLIFHSRIEEEKGTFSVKDVIGEICDKMILRHPHVFATVSVKDSDEVLDNWDKIKKAEKNRVTVRENMESVPKQLPSLMRAKKIIKKARKDGYVFDDTSEISRKICEIADIIAKNDGKLSEKDAGELIFLATLAAGDSADLEKTVSDKVDSFIENYPETR